jgi:uncharacterized protein (TIGR02611 family)
MWIETLRQARRISVAVIGFTAVLLGIVMFVTPGPGWLVVLLGLSILSAEFLWARRLMKRIKATGRDLAQTIFRQSNEPQARDQKA